MPMHKYIFLPTRELWPASSVNARLAPVKTSGSGRPVSANKWLDQNRPVEQMTWAPGEPTLLEGHLISEGGWIPRAGCTILNLYRPPSCCKMTSSNALPARLPRARSSKSGPSRSGSRSSEETRHLHISESDSGISRFDRGEWEVVRQARAAEVCLQRWKDSSGTMSRRPLRDPNTLSHRVLLPFDWRSR